MSSSSLDANCFGVQLNSFKTPKEKFLSPLRDGCVIDPQIDIQFRISTVSFFCFYSFCNSPFSFLLTLSKSHSLSDYCRFSSVFFCSLDFFFVGLCFFSFFVSLLSPKALLRFGAFEAHPNDTWNSNRLPVRCHLHRPQTWPHHLWIKRSGQWIRCLSWGFSEFNIWCRPSVAVKMVLEACLWNQEKRQQRSNTITVAKQDPEAQSYSYRCATRNILLVLDPILL